MLQGISIIANSRIMSIMDAVSALPDQQAVLGIPVKIMMNGID